MTKDYPHGNMAWFEQARFGMFIHWGLYAMGARHEWLKTREFMRDDAYQVYFDLFEPDLFEPQQWAKAAKAAGMKYVVITAKHHEGFCLWDSKFTDYKVSNTSAGRDLLREIVEAFRAEGLRIGLYYSLLDWHHPNFTIDPIHPLRNLPEPEIVQLNAARDMRRYTQYMRDQVTELLTEYGKIDILWFDFSYASRGKGANEWEAEKMIELVRSLQPEIILNNRLDLPGAGDIETPEQYVPEASLTDTIGRPVYWEGCQTFATVWGYCRDEADWKSSKMCIEMLITHVARNGNFLMNVGPTSRGFLDSRVMERLEGFAEWMRYNNRAIYGCGAAPNGFEAPRNCLYTYNQERKRLYLHCLVWPYKHIHLPGLAGKLRYAQLLTDGSEILIRREIPQYNENLNSVTPENAVTLELPVQLPKQGTEVPVIELILW